MDLRKVSFNFNLCESEKLVHKITENVIDCRNPGCPQTVVLGKTSFRSPFASIF